MKNKFWNTVNASGTNAFFGVAGIVFFANGLPACGISFFLLMIGSGLYHYFRTPATKKMDFAGMYMILATLFFTWLAPLDWAALLMAALLTAFAFAIKVPMRVVIGVLFSACLVAVWMQTGGQDVLQITAWAALGYVNREMGDKINKPFESLFHGIGWHIPEAYMLYLIGFHLLLNH